MRPSSRPAHVLKLISAMRHRSQHPRGATSPDGQAGQARRNLSVGTLLPSGGLGWETRLQA
eukprot:6780240-Alexandrium_andersonii.AAC.1